MPDRIPYDARVVLTRKIMGVLARWDIEPMDQCRLLGLPSSEAGYRFRRLRQGDVLGDESETWERVALLLRIENAVNQVFPHSSVSADLWVTTPRAKFANRTPLELMLEGGIEGIRRVARSLDNLAAL